MPRHSPTPLRHPWNVTPAEARQIQGQLRSRVSHKNGPELRNIRYVAGVDCSLRDSGTLSALANWDPSQADSLPTSGSNQSLSLSVARSIFGDRKRKLLK